MTDELPGTVPASTDVAPATPNTTEVPGDTAQTPPAQAEAEASTAPAPEPKKVDPRQRKIAELSYRLREQDRHIDRLIGLAEKQVSARQPAEDKPPRIEDFSTIDEYVDAKLEHRERQKTAKAEPARAEQDNHAAEAKAARDDLIMTGSEKYEDFEEKVFSQDVRITPYMADAILNLDEPDMKADIAYYLASNPKEALQISRLHPGRQAAEIGKLEMKLASKTEPQKKPSAAPEPIKPVSSASKVNDVDPSDKDDINTWFKKREKQLGRK